MKAVSIELRSLVRTFHLNPDKSVFVHLTTVEKLPRERLSVLYPQTYLNQNGFPFPS